MYRRRQNERAIVATLVIGALTIALLLVMIYPSPMHILRVY
jgi:hypothetical protein